LGGILPLIIDIMENKCENFENDQRKRAEAI